MWRWKEGAGIQISGMATVNATENNKPSGAERGGRGPTNDGWIQRACRGRGGMYCS
jgi:hypothetical protein